MGRKIIGLALVLLVVSFSSCSLSDEGLPISQEELIRRNIAEWFDGEKLHRYGASNRDYDWYIDQADTGDYSHSNCGPASAVMAMRWLDEDFQGSVEEAREEYLLAGGWWYSTIITSYFKDRGVEFELLSLNSQELDESIGALEQVIDDGKIAIVCINMKDITMEMDRIRRINRFYSYGDGHFLIIKGYAQVDDKNYLEVYDPNSWGLHYEDGQLLGKDRYYLADELINSARAWYEFALILSPKEESQ